MCFGFLYNFCLEYFSFSKEFSEILSYLDTGLHVKYSFFLSEFHQTRTSWQIFKKVLKYHISWKSVQCGPEERWGGHTDMTKLTVAFRNFANTLNERHSPGHSPWFTESPTILKIAGRWLTRSSIVSCATLNLQRGTKPGVNGMMEPNY